MARVRAWRDEPALTVQFATRAAVAVAIVGLLVHVLVGQQVRRQYEEFAYFHAVFVAETVLQNQLVASDLTGPVEGARYDALAAFVEDNVLQGDVTGVKVWRPDGTVVFADDMSLVGRQDPDLVEHLASAVAQGGSSEVMAVDETPADAPPMETTTVVHTYTPVEVVGGGTAIVEIYQDREPSVAAAGAFTRVLDSSLVAGLGLLYVLLLPIAARTGRRLRKQSTDLAVKNQQLTGLLAREQDTVSRLEELGEMKDTFLTAVSHELRTPLTMVLGNAVVLDRRAGSLSEEQRAQLTSALVGNARRLDGLLTDLLDLNRLTGGGTADQLVDVDLADLVRGVAGERAADSHDLTLDLQPVTVRATPVQVERLVDNLVANAYRHTPTGSAIEVSTRPTPDGPLLVVEDNGRGVPDDIKEEIFRPFRQGPSLHPHAPGTGVGLSLVVRLAQRQQATVSVHDRPGGGASFRVQFPPGPATPGIVESDATDTVAAPAGPSGRAAASRAASGTPASTPAP